MVLIAISLISIFAVFIDWYIYRRIVRRNLLNRLLRRTYIAYAVFADVMIVLALIIYRVASDATTNTMLHVVMWVICMFFINAFPKFIYFVVSLGDYVVERFTHKRSHVFGYAGTILGIMVLSVMVHGATLGRSQMEVRRVAIHSDRVPKAFNGFRIVQFSDVHIGTLMQPEKTLRCMVDTINSLNADIVVQSGDLVNTHAGELTSTIIEHLREIRSAHGVYSVLGNHDLGFYIFDSTIYSPRSSVAQILSVQQAMGWHTLVNRSQILTIESDSIAISGVNFPSEYRHNGHSSEMSGVDLTQTYTEVPDSIYNITISHAPQMWDNLLEIDRSDLTLAGHVHSMQIKLKLGKWLWSPARFLYSRWSGLYSEQGRHLYINDGIGYVMYPMRIGTRPEITLIELYSK